MESISTASVRIPLIERGRVRPGYASAADVLSRPATLHGQRSERESRELHLGECDAAGVPGGPHTTYPTPLLAPSEDSRNTAPR